MPETQEYKDAVVLYHAADYERAFPALLPFAEAGHPEAECMIGTMYDLGFGREADITQAMLWYQRSAEHGYGVAANNLGTIYLSGRCGDAPDKSRAREWYERARAMGFSYSPRVD
jgi:uncharacterized protein